MFIENVEGLRRADALASATYWIGALVSPVHELIVRFGQSAASCACGGWSGPMCGDVIGAWTAHATAPVVTEAMVNAMAADLLLGLADADDADHVLGRRIADVGNVPLSDGGRVRWLSEWIDRFPANVARTPDELRYVRTAKVAAEYGEALDAYVMARLGVHVGRLHDTLSGVSGENPRKGVTHTIDDLAYELLDVALAALNAHEHFTGNRGGTMAALSRHIGHVYDRARSV